MELAKEKRGHFLYRLFCPEENFFLTFLFYLSVSCIKYTFGRYILSHIKCHLTMKLYTDAYFSETLCLKIYWTLDGAPLISFGNYYCMFVVMSSNHYEIVIFMSSNPTVMTWICNLYEFKPSCGDVNLQYLWVQTLLYWREFAIFMSSNPPVS